jgi:hypothetical protein
MTGTAIRDAKDEYANLGLDTLPLRPGEKRPFCGGWQTRPPEEMWPDAPAEANIGIRCGGKLNLAVLDADDKERPGTFDNLQHVLAGLGIGIGSYPLVQTASGVGRQIYILGDGALPGNYRLWDEALGAGELRYGSGAYVTAPPSVVGSSSYRLLAGDFHHMPTLPLKELLPLLKNQDCTPSPARMQPGSQLAGMKLSRRTLALLHGEHLEGYRSGSEAEQAILTSLVNSGLPYESALGLFLHNPCAGKFRELYAASPEKAERWLHASYDKARTWAGAHTSLARQRVIAAQEWADSRPWPGRTGAIDYRVFMAHLKLAHQAGRPTYAASSRDLGELAHVSYMTATNATRRLSSSGYLKIAQASVGECANCYELILPDQTYALPHSPLVRECISLVSHDAFRVRGLGIAAGQVWVALQEHGAQTITELAQRTGRPIRTIKRVLKRMATVVDKITGEVVHMVEADGQQWRSLPVDLNQVAELVGTSGASARQHAQHIKERRDRHQELVRRGKAGSVVSDETDA